MQQKLLQVNQKETQKTRTILNRGQKKTSTFPQYSTSRRNHANFDKLPRTIGDSIGLQSDPTGHVINLSNKIFAKDTYTNF